MKKLDRTVFEGLYEKNTVLISGLVSAPIIAVSNTFKSAIGIIYAFSAITFFSILIASFLPRKMVYTVRVILYTVIAALVYVPVAMLGRKIFPAETITAIGIYFPLLALNSIIMSQTEKTFFKKPKFEMTVSLIFYILGFDIVALLVGVFREIFAFGSINGNIVGIYRVSEALSAPFGGFIILGVLSALFKGVKTMIDKWRN